MIYGIKKYQNPRITKHSQMGGDTSNPKISTLITQQKLPISQGGRHFKPPHLEIDNPVEALNRSTQQTLAEEDEVFKQLQKTQANIFLWGLLMASYKTLSKPNRPSQSNPSPYNHNFP